ncbi:MAG: carbohydrate binding domain-containing protein, partial [Planctomycetaceae bacterium]
RKDWLFYQWVSWNTGSYVQPNDEFQGYTQEDIEFLDRCISTATRLSDRDTDGSRFRLERLAEAWKFQRSLLVSFLDFYPASLKITASSESDRQAVLERARHVAEVQQNRSASLSRMRSHPSINPRASQIGFWSNGSAISIFSHENALLDELCSAATRFHLKTQGKAVATRFWQSVDRSDSLHDAARTQVAMLGKRPVSRLINGGFESGDLRGWVVEDGQVAVAKGQARSGSFSVASRIGGPTTISQKVSVSPFERYRLTAWGRYTTKPAETAVPLEATVEFFDRQRVVYAVPTRCMLRTLDPSDEWARLRLTVSVPAHADSAVIKLKRTFNTNTLWDDVVLERLREGPPIEHGTLVDAFGDQRLDLNRWTRMPPQGGVDPPPIRNGSLAMDEEGVHPVNSLARFNDLIKHRGPDRYRLRLHTTATAPTVKGQPSMASFSLGNSQRSVTRMLWYFYFSGPGRSQPMLSCFNDQAGIRKFTSSWNVKHLGNRGRDIWFTLYFDSTEVSVFASAGGYDESDNSLVCRYKHGLSNMAANGSIYLGLYKGRYRVDEIQLVRPKRGQQ